MYMRGRVTMEVVLFIIFSFVLILWSSPQNLLCRLIDQISLGTILQTIQGYINTIRFSCYFSVYLTTKQLIEENFKYPFVHPHCDLPGSATQRFLSCRMQQLLTRPVWLKFCLIWLRSHSSATVKFLRSQYHQIVC